MNKHKRNIRALIIAIEDALVMKKGLDEDISRIGTVLEKIIPTYFYIATSHNVSFALYNQKISLMFHV